MNDKLLEYFNGDELAASTWFNKYAIDGELTPDDMHRRMAKEFARIEQNYIEKEGHLFPDNLSEYAYERHMLDEDTIYQLFKDFKYVIPGGSVMATLGSDKLSSLSNCFVIDSPKDSISGIMNQLNNQSQLMKYRGGVGFDISTLRPMGSTVSNAAKTSTGAASFMDLFSNVTNTIAQNGRRGALILSMNINHPDIEEFIIKKQDLSKVTGANVSVQITDDFMNAVERDKDYILRWPVDSNSYFMTKESGEELEYNVLYNATEVFNFNEAEAKYIKRVKAKELWNKLIQCAHNTAEPGIMFIDRIHDYSPDGIYPEYKAVSTNPCGEIPMGPYDSCRLMHLNLTSFVENPYTPDVKLKDKELSNVAYMTMRLSDDLIDLEIEAIDKIIHKIKKSGDTNELTLWENIRKTTISGRRTGMGFTGLADVIAMFNYKYGDDDSLLLTKQIMDIIMTAQLDCTIDLALLRKPFPAYNEELEFGIIDDIVTFTGSYGTNDFYEFIKINYPRQFERMYTNYIGRRNISWSTVAPTGTVSLLTQTSSGIEPVFLPYYQRRRKCSSPDDRVDYIDNVGEKYTEFFVLHPEFKKWINLQFNTKCKIYNILNKESLEQAYKDSPWYNSTASEINWKDRIEIQSIIQKYTTHAISSTLNLNSNITENEVNDIYMNAWHKGLKGVTIYRDGSRSGILNSIKEEDTESGRQAKKRPKVLVADYYQVKSKGKQYIVLVGLLNNKPYEVFTFQPTLDVDIKPHKGTITKLKKGQYAYDSDYIQIANLELSTDNIEEKACSLYTSMLLRHNADIKFIVKTAKKVNENITSFSSAMCRVLSKYIENEEVKGEVCPECGGKLIRESGCVKCLDCDYSKCL